MAQAVRLCCLNLKQLLLFEQVPTACAVHPFAFQCSYPIYCKLSYFHNHRGIDCTLLRLTCCCEHMATVLSYMTIRSEHEVLAAPNDNTLLVFKAWRGTGQKRFIGLDTGWST